MAYTFNQKNWVAGEVITANGVNRIEECLGHLVDEKQNILYFDAVPTAGSSNLVDSNGIYNALNALGTFTIDRRPTSNSRNAVQSRGIYEALLGKQDLLIFDSTPKSNSSNPVTSQGIYQALNLKQNKLTFDSTPISNSNNPVTSNGIYQALNLKQNNLTFDSTPNSESNNPVTSSGIYRVLRLKQNNLTFDSIPTLNSSNPVTSEGIYISLQNLLGEVNNSLEEIELKIPNAQVQSDWNITDSTSKAYIKNKPLIGTVTSITTGIGLTGGNITGSGTIKVKLKSEIAFNFNSTAAIETSNRIYPIAVDKSGYLAVNVPWTDSKPVTSVAGKIGAVTLTKGDVGLGNVDNKSSVTIRSEITSSNITTALGFTPLDASLKGANNGIAELNSSGKVPFSQLPSYTASEVGAIPITEKGISGGVATLDENGIVPSSQLPAYVDTISEYSSFSNFPSQGEPGKIYVALDTNKSYRWSGTQYTEISSSISLGEVQGTAYEGHKGKANALAINELQNKLAQINIEAEKNVQSDWNITDINSDAYIKNKPNIINTITENNNNLVTSGAIYTELIKKQNNLINVPEISEIRPTDYIYIERNRTIYKILASKLGTFTPDESDPNAIETNDGNIITDENGNEIIIDNNSDSDPNAVETNNGNVILDENGNEIIINTNTTDIVETNDGKVILTEDQRELNLG